MTKNSSNRRATLALFREEERPARSLVLDRPLPSKFLPNTATTKLWQDVQVLLELNEALIGFLHATQGNNLVADTTSSSSSNSSTNRQLALLLDMIRARQPFQFVFVLCCAEYYYYYLLERDLKFRI
jgi:hypothetical protein